MVSKKLTRRGAVICSITFLRDQRNPSPAFQGARAALGGGLPTYADAVASRNFPAGSQVGGGGSAGGPGATPGAIQLSQFPAQGALTAIAGTVPGVVQAAKAVLYVQVTNEW
jgi:hypothetical protein